MFLFRTESCCSQPNVILMDVMTYFGYVNKLQIPV